LSGIPGREPGRHLVLVGPTAAGKSEVAMELALRRTSAGDPVEIVSADSMQVYRGMDLGTAKPSEEERRRVPHHLVDVIAPSQEYSVAEFARAVREAIDDIEARGRRAILVGGTGLYVQAVVDDLQMPGRYPEVAARLAAEADTARLHRELESLDPVAALRIEPSNRRRVVRALEVTLGAGRPFSDFGPGLGAYPATPFVLAGLELDRAELSERIRRRFAVQMSAGFLEEVRRLRGESDVTSRTAAQALGYRELGLHLDGLLTLEEAVELAVTRTRQFAVRQIRWFRRDPRIEWFAHDEPAGSTVLRLDRYWTERISAGEGSRATVGAEQRSPPTGVG
jgi:tRNA dimethylallyltransferase